MTDNPSELRTHYRFRDFLRYTCLLAVPILTAILAIFRHSLFWTVAYLVIAAVMTALILRHYCTHCPHYTRDEGPLTCIFFWGLPKVFSPRPGPLTMMDKVVTLAAPTVLVMFPLYWLFKEPGLLMIYLLSLTGFGATIYHDECHRCIYYECPVNRVPEEIRKDFEQSPPQ